MQAQDAKESEHRSVALIASGQNVKRLVVFGGRRPKKLAQAAALRPPAATGHEVRCAREHRAERSWPPTRVFFNTLLVFRNNHMVFLRLSLTQGSD
jgi:hypothetical protein